MTRSLSRFYFNKCTHSLPNPWHAAHSTDSYSPHAKRTEEPQPSYTAQLFALYFQRDQNCVSPLWPGATPCPSSKLPQTKKVNVSHSVRQPATDQHRRPTRHVHAKSDHRPSQGPPSRQAPPEALSSDGQPAVPSGMSVVDALLRKASPPSPIRSLLRMRLRCAAASARAKLLRRVHSPPPRELLGLCDGARMAVATRLPSRFPGPSREWGSRGPPDEATLHAFSPMEGEGAHRTFGVPLGDAAGGADWDRLK